MARVAGVEIPRNKVVATALTYVYGIGQSASGRILRDARVDPQTRVKDLSEDELSRIRAIIDKSYKVEGELRSQVTLDIKRLQDIGCYRGIRHKRGLPVRGQRTRHNARTRKGPRKTVAGKKQASEKK